MLISAKTPLKGAFYLNTKAIEPNVSFFNVMKDQGIDVEKYNGRKLLIVNLASRCGYTPQYSELEQLNKNYGDKISILGFPSNEFGNQEPGSDKEIQEFCKVNFGVTFELFRKESVKGENAQPIFKWLASSSANGWNDISPKWNFYKYLISESGRLEGVIASSISPLSKILLDKIQ
ncbi:MAG: glutathione peroxidase [Ginsengibacter sp.]